MKTVLVKLTPDQARSYTGPVFAPIDDDLDGLPYGEVMVEIKKNRNPKNHRRYFAFIKAAFDMQDFYDNPEVFRKVLQLRAGFFDEAFTKEDKMVYLARPIAWDELDEIEFKKLFNQVISSFIADHPTLDDMQLNTLLEF